MSDARDDGMHFRTCNLCEAMCGLAVEVEGGRIRRIAGDKADPFSRGHVCPKAVALRDVHEDPDRLRRPLRRTAGGWEAVSWEEAFDEAAARLREVQARHGRDAVGVYLGNPTVHHLGAMLFAPPFVRSLRTRNRFSATSVDQLPHHYAAHFMFGHPLLIPVPDVDRTGFFLILGANPAASNGSLMTAPGMRRRLRDLRERGGTVVVVDPRRSETAALADAHHFIRPGTDALFLLAMLHTLFAEGLVRPGRLAGFTDGTARIEALAASFPPERVAERTGIDAAAVRELARAFASAERAVCYGRIGVSTQAFGAVCQWLINVVNVVTGNLDRPGGAMFTTPAVDVVRQAKGRRPGRWKSRVRGLPEFGGELPVATLAEEILTGGEGQIRALVTFAGNPVLSTPNGAGLEGALPKLDFMLSIDPYLNETTRHAHLILPPAGALESAHYDLVFHLLAVRNTAKYSPALFEPEPGAKYDWEILRELRKRMEAGRRPKRVGAWIRRKVQDRMTPERMLDLGLRLGPYGVWGGRKLSREGLSLKRLKRRPHGVDLGPLAPRLPERLHTPDRRIHLAPEALAEDVKRVEAELLATEADVGFDLTLIGRRQLRSNNSWMHNVERLVKGKERCTLLIHPSDAEARGIRSGQPVEVRSRVGAVVLPAEVSDEVMPGVVSIPHGWGHHRPGVRLRVAERRPGVSLNDLTDDRLVDPLCGTAAFSNARVAVRLREPEPA